MNKGIRPHENGVSGTASDPNVDGSTSVVSDDNGGTTATQVGVGPVHDQEAVAGSLDGTEPQDSGDGFSQPGTAALKTSVPGYAAAWERTTEVQATTAQERRPFHEPFMKAAAFGRVARLDTESIGSLDDQITLCTAAAEEARYQVGPCHIFREIGSGISRERDVLKQLLAVVQAQEVKAVWIVDVARLSRDLPHLLTVFREFVDNGVVLRVVGEAASLDLTSDFLPPSGGKVRLAQQGLKPVGNAVFGKDYAPHAEVRVANPAEAQIVPRIFYLVMAGESLSRIAKDLNRRGVPTKARRLVGWYYRQLLRADASNCGQFAVRCLKRLSELFRRR